MSPFSPAMGILVYASGFLFHMFMLFFMLYMQEYVSCVFIIMLMVGFAWGYNDCIDWSKKWSEDEKKNS